MASQSKEQWKNVSRGIALVNVYDSTGNRVDQEIVRSGRTVVLSPEERRLLNQDRTASDSLDIFSNGVLRPLSLADDSEDLSENPNHMTEGDMRDIFSLRNHLKFKSALSEIESVPVLQRLLFLVDNDDDEGDESLNPTVKQRESIVTRLDKLQVRAVDVVEVTNVGHVSGSFGEDERSQVQPFRSE